MIDRPKRRAIPMRAQRDAALWALRLDPANTEFNHDPPIELRPLNDAGTDTVPPMNDPRHIVPMSKEAHKKETFGDPAVPLSGHISRIAKTKRLEEKHVAFRQRMLARGDDPFTEDKLLASITGWCREVTWPKRAWPKGRKIARRVE